MKKGWVYDYETIVNCFVAVFRELNNPKNRKVFIISPWHNDYEKIHDFLIECKESKSSLYSYNGLKFDNQISQWIIDPKNYSKYKHRPFGPYSEIYSFAQKTIQAGDFKSGIKFEYPSWDNPFRERDILKINNYDNPNKRTSLKWIQYSIDWPNLQDMPMQHYVPITEEQIADVIKYCDNDVLSLRKKILLDKNEILLRDTLTNFFNVDLLSASEPQIAKKIFGLALSKAMKISEKELSKMQTERKYIKLDQIILNYIKFKTPTFQKTLQKFNKLTLDANNLKGSFKANAMYRGLDISFALGGIHGAKRGWHKAEGNNVIKTFDVVSYYPNLAIKNNWSPAHLPVEIFVTTYNNQFEERRKYDKKNPLNYVYKIVLNSAYGLSNEKHGSFLKDSLFTMKITCNGQLLLAMLMEELVETIPGCRPLMINTDGGEVIFDKKYMHLYDEICKKWEALTKLELEHDEYKELIIADVNTYLAINKEKEISKEEAIELLNEAKQKNTVKPLIKFSKKLNKYYHCKIKLKGRYEIEKPVHKNKSYTVLKKMIYNYFVHKIPFVETLNQNKNIMDFCAVVRAKGTGKIFYNVMDTDNINMVKVSMQKTNRYFVSNSGGKLKTLTEKTENLVEAYRGYETILNLWDPKKPFEEYDIDKKYYLQRANDEIAKYVELEIKNNNLFNF